MAYKTLLYTLLCAVLAALVTGVIPAKAQEKPLIAVLNVQEIMRDSLAAKSVKEQFDRKQKSFSDELSSKEETLQKEQQELAKQRSVLAQEAFEKKVREFQTKAADVQKEVQKKKNQLDKGLGQAFTEIQKAVSGILADMAKEKGFVVVVPTQQILYNEPSLDITAEVLKRLDSKLPKVSLKFSD